MKRNLFCLFLLIGSVVNIFGQGINKDNLYGDWYLIDRKSGTTLETFTFKREMLDSTFTKWSFKNNGTLIVGSGYLTNFYSKSEQKGAVLHSLDNLKWSMNKTDNQLPELKITNSGKVDQYTVIFLNNERLQLRLDKTTLLTE